VSNSPKPLYINNADLVREFLEYFDPASNGWLPWTGPATVTYCTRSVDSAGVPTYTPIASLGPFDMVPLGGAQLGYFYYVTPSATIAALAAAPYLGSIVYCVIAAGSSQQLLAVQPRMVSPELNPQ
jgi:hypothetical protein